MITPKPGYMVDPNNPNGVVRIPDPAQVAMDEVAKKGGAQPGAKVENQGKAGYDVFGNPVVRYSETPVTPSSAVSRYTTPTTPNDKISSMFAEGGVFGDRSFTGNDEQKIRDEELNRSQAKIDAINASFQRMISETAPDRENRLGRTRALASSTGVLGSPTGDTYEEGARKTNKAELDTYEAERQNQIYTTITGAEDRASERIKMERENVQKNSEAYMNFINESAGAAKTDLSNLSKLGVSFDKLSEQEPDVLKKLLDESGISETEARALFIANSPKDTYINKDKPEIVGGKAVFFKQVRDPLTGKMTISSDSVDLPDAAVDPKNVDIVTREDGIYIINKVPNADGSYTTTRVGQPNPKKGTGDGSGTDIGGDVPFQATIENAASLEGSVSGVARTQKELANLANTGDYKSLLIRLQNQAKKGMAATDKTEVMKAEKQVSAATRMEKALTDFQNAGGDMNYLKGKADTIASRLGKLATDPKYKALATELTAAFQQYRNDMTGAAFGAAESADYAQVVPTKDKEINLNLAVLQGLKNYMQGKVDDSYGSVLGEGYANVKSKIGASTEGGGGGTTRMTGPDGKMYDVPNNQVEAFKAAGGK